MQRIPLRRLVTTDDANARPIVAFAGAPLQTVTLNGSAITRLWETSGVPTSVPLARDAGATAGNAYRPGFAGTSLYVADIFPGTVGAIPLHRQDSLDYIAILSGEIHLLLDGKEEVLRAGDVLVQGGNLHTWENRSDAPCRMLVVVLSAHRTT